MSPRIPKLPPPSERQVSDAIRDLLARVAPDLMLMRNEQGRARTGTPAGLGRGSSDLIGILAGRVIALEVKAPKGIVAAHQEEWLDKVRAFGGFAAVVRSPAEAMDAVGRARLGESR